MLSRRHPISLILQNCLQCLRTLPAARSQRSDASPSRNLLPLPQGCSTFNLSAPSLLRLAYLSSCFRLLKISVGNRSTPQLAKCKISVGDCSRHASRASRAHDMCQGLAPKQLTAGDARII
jgi:hypothetical protein